MTTFVEQYGHIKYKPSLIKAVGPCEIPGCEELRRQALVAELRRALDTHALYSSNPPSWYKGPYYRYHVPYYVVDHCHQHGYIRGILCGSCNNLMREFDQKGHAAPSEWGYIFGFANMLRTEDIIPYLYLQEYSRNCPECAGIRDYKVSQIPQSLRNPKLTQCPNCLGDCTEPEQPDQPCTYCNGTGKAKKIERVCYFCGRYRKIYWLAEMCCKDCYESMEEDYDEDIWEDYAVTPDGPLPLIIAESLDQIGIHFDPNEVYSVGQ